MASREAPVTMDATVARLRILKAQSSGLVTGVKLPQLRVRKEIDEFVQDTDCFNLYLLGLHDLQRSGWEDDFSYSQIAGIHGRPNMPWRNISQDFVPGDVVQSASEAEEAVPQKIAGYCTHSSDLFPTWHRVYMAMFEQALFAKMVEVAMRFESQQDQTRYLSAAARFGLPYWDPLLPRRKVTNKYGYAITKYGIPVVMSSLEIMVRDPAQPGQLREIPNPLYSFHFVDVQQAGPKGPHSRAASEGIRDMFEGFTHIPGMSKNTVRGPDRYGISDHHYINNTLTNAVSPAAGPATSLVSKIYRTLSNPTMPYEKMANSAFVESKTIASGQNHENSIEGIHNDIHTKCGQGMNESMGHMGLTPIAAFDPIFWLHHANVDRLFAIWQGLNPDAWGWERRTTYVTGRQGIETPDSPLIPFLYDPAQRHGEQTWWTSNDVRHCEALGYSYPELLKSRSSAGEKPHVEVQALRQWVTDSYFWSTVAGGAPAEQVMLDLTRVEALPQILRIDETNDIVQLNVSDAKAPVDKAKKNGWFHRKSKTTTPDVEKAPTKGPYEHLMPLMEGSRLRQWNVTIKVEKFALGGSFQIFLFLGDYNRHYPSSWPHDHHLLGVDGVFANNSIAQCPNCQVQQRQGLLDSDVISLSSSLITYCNNAEIHGGLRLQSLKPQDVLPFLMRNLHWSVLDSRGRLHDPSEVRSLTLAVGSQLVTLPSGHGALPVYENEQIHTVWNAVRGWHNVAPRI